MYITCNIVMKKMLFLETTCFHTNWVILLMSLFTSVFVHTINAHVDICGCSAYLDEKVGPSYVSYRMN